MWGQHRARRRGLSALWHQPRRGIASVERDHRSPWFAINELPLSARQVGQGPLHGSWTCRSSPTRLSARHPQGDLGTGLAFSSFTVMVVIGFRNTRWNTCALTSVTRKVLVVASSQVLCQRSL